LCIALSFLSGWEESPGPPLSIISMMPSSGELLRTPFMRR
jgi:hypothetical protein